MRFNLFVRGDGFGGGIYNGAASTHSSNLGAPTVMMVEFSSISRNKAQGGSAADDSSPGDGLGGGLWNGGTASVFDSVFSRNHALGGDAPAGGNGFGGGVYNATAASLRLERSTVTKNHSNGSEGEGIGGGVFNLGSLDLDALTLIFDNHASTSHDDVFDLLG